MTHSHEHKRDKSIAHTHPVTPKTHNRHRQQLVINERFIFGMNLTEKQTEK